jgi:hypothetical protein
MLVSFKNQIHNLHILAVNLEESAQIHIQITEYGIRKIIIIIRPPLYAYGSGKIIKCNKIGKTGLT